MRPESDAAATGHNATALVVEGIGARVRVDVTGPGAREFAERMHGLWSRCVPQDGPDAPGAAVLDAVAVALTGEDDVWELLERTTQRITLALLNQRQEGRALLFHAGGVSHPITGRSAVYVARSFTGKTRLTLELAQHFGYLSDESIAIAEDFSIVPYPKPLSVRDPHGGPRRELGPDALGLRTLPARPHLTHLLLLDRRDDHDGPPKADVLDVFDAVALLGPQTSWLSSLTAGLHRLDVLLQHTGGALKVTYREASTLLPLVTDLLGDPDRADPDAHASEPRVQFVAPTDTLTRDGDALLLYDDHVVRLGPLGTAIIAECRRPIGIRALAERLTARLGAPDDRDAHAATLAAVEQLVADGVLGWVGP